MINEPTRLDEAVRAAAQSIEHDILPSETIDAMDQEVIKLLKPSMGPKEKVMFAIKQSRLHAPLDPDIILVTNRRIAIVHPSVWHYFKIQPWSLKSFEELSYTKITKLAATRGLFLISVNIFVLGTPNCIEICGLRWRDTRLLMKFVELVLGYLEG
jgi:hypothetical protein